MWFRFEPSARERKDNDQSRLRGSWPDRPVGPGGFYSNRIDFIRTAIRNQLQRHEDAVKASASRKSLDLGLHTYTRARLEAAQRAGQTIEINVLGLAMIAPDVTPELARATISSVVVLGALQATPEVKAALADRTH